jgi:hypothetical protein
MKTMQRMIFIGMEIGGTKMQMVAGGADGVIAARARGAAGAYATQRRTQ